jgi:hypothetical protein
MPQSLYMSLDAYKRFRIETTTTNDTRYLDELEQASRVVDGFCRREFFTVDATRHFSTGNSADEILIDDFLSISAFTTDSEDDGTYDGETWTEGTDFWAMPDNAYPRTWVETTSFGNYSFPANARRYVKITGTWGYGDGTASPWLATSINLTVANGTATQFTAASDPTGVIEVGHTLLVESEQAGIVTAIASGTVDVDRRGINGTTAAAHSAKPASIAQYPPAVSMAVRELALADESTRDSKGHQSGEQDGKGQTNIMQPHNLILPRWLGPYRRLEV